jgi:hypothetical protein
MKTPKAHFSVCIAFTAFMVFGCGKDSYPVGPMDVVSPPPPDNNFYIHATLRAHTPRTGIFPESPTFWSGGVELDICGNTFTLSGSHDLNFGYGGGYWGVQGGSGGCSGSGPAGKIEIKLMSNTILGTHLIDGSSQGAASFSMWLGPRWVTLPSGPAGEFTINSFDTSKNIVIGSFRFVGVVSHLTHPVFRAHNTDTLSVTCTWFRARVSQR